MTADPGSFLPVALRAADIASELIRTRRPASVTEKSDRDLVSDVDLAIERAVRGYLHDTTPDTGFLGEEEGQSGDPGTGWLWTLDPIDGTSNFAHGLPLCAISLALLHDGRPVVAVIDAPFLGERYHAVEGKGAYAGERPLKASTTARLRDAVVAIGDYATGDGADRKNEQRLAATIQLTPRVHRIRMLGTAAVDLAWVADGRLDASVTLGNKPWDTSAGVLIAREAGATVTDANGRPHDLNSAATIAAAPALISQLIPLIQAADLTADPKDSQSGYASPHTALDSILSRARHLIFDFDGPLCDLTASIPSTAADQLRAILRTGTAADLPAAIATTSDPIDIIARAVAISPRLAARLDAELTRIEVTAASTARPAAYVHEALAACRDSGRTPAVISRSSAQAVSSYLDKHGLADQVQNVMAIASFPPGHMQTFPHLLEDAIHALGAIPADCALITATKAGIDTANGIGAHPIAYATTPATSEHLTAAGARCLIPSLADLTLRLRARPLPN
jgi:myo-inositol-1(or 4)-monophosphatase